jgi:hypothetical protein
MAYKRKAMDRQVWTGCPEEGKVRYRDVASKKQKKKG